MEEQIIGRIKDQLDLLNIYEYLFGAISTHKIIKKEYKVPIEISVKSNDYFTNIKLVQIAIDRFKSIGIDMYLKDEVLVIS